MSQVLIITGMGRSGTSLVSSLLQSAGVHVGDRLLPPFPDNPRGYFEDVDFYEFHEQILHARGQTYLYVDTDFVFEPTSAELERAKQLVAERSARPIWGWKDPRTALFLEFWDRLLPHARYLFVYRHPIEVLLSLLRRGEFDNHPYLAAGLRAWQIFNGNITAFYERHGDRCLLAHIDGLVADVERFARLLRQKLQLEVRLDSAVFGQTYHADELQKAPLAPDAAEVLARLCPGLLELYGHLNAQADVPPNFNQSNVDTSPTLSKLAGFTADLSEPISSPVTHSLLQLFVSMLVPGPSETMLSRFHGNIRGAQRTVEHLWLEVQRLQRMTAVQGDTLKNQQSLLEVQQAQLEAQQFKLIAQQAELDEQRSQLEAQQAELRQVHETRSWKLIQSYSRLKDKWQRKAG
jgi:hypothetical protein